jgi:hypothetical protein
MEHGYRAEERHQWEARYPLLGRRSAGDFHAELLNRSAGASPPRSEWNKPWTRLLAILPGVLNKALVGRQTQPPAASGWQRRLLAWSTTPEGAEGSDEIGMAVNVYVPAL